MNEDVPCDGIKDIGNILLRDDIDPLGLSFRSEDEGLCVKLFNKTIVFALGYRDSILAGFFLDNFYIRESGDINEKATYKQFLSPNDIKCTRLEHVRVKVVIAQISNAFTQTT